MPAPPSIAGARSSHPSILQQYDGKFQQLVGVKFVLRGNLRRSPESVATLPHIQSLRICGMFSEPQMLQGGRTAPIGYNLCNKSVTDPVMPCTANQPGYRRAIRVIPCARAVLAMLEDDLHCLGVILRHDRVTVVAVEPVADRLPWNTCPGAAAKLVETFEGSSLEDVTARRDKKANCTHFHDLAVLAAAHVFDGMPLSYDIIATDPVDDVRWLEIRRNGLLVHTWMENAGVLSWPAEVAGLSLLTMRDHIAGLTGVEQEAARLLQWASLVAHGRTILDHLQSRASDLPANCFTLQPERALTAERVGDKVDFSEGSRMPLAGFGDRMLAMLAG